MLKPWVGLLILTVTLAGCAHRGAMRVDCDGPLRPINRPRDVEGCAGHGRADPRNTGEW